MTMMHECGQFAAAMLYLSGALTLISLMCALVGLAATQSRFPEYGIASAFGGAAILGSVGGLGLGWAAVGTSFLLIVPACPLLFGGLVFAAISSMKHRASRSDAACDAKECLINPDEREQRSDSEKG